MKQILNEKNEVLFEGIDHEIELVYDYLTMPFFVLCEKRNLTMNDAYKLNEKYWNDKSRNAKSFQIKNLN